MSLRDMWQKANSLSTSIMSLRDCPVMDSILVEYKVTPSFLSPDRDAIELRVLATLKRFYRTLVINLLLKFKQLLLPMTA